MLNILVTGSSGFIGKNLCAQLELNDQINVLKFTKKSTLIDLKNHIKKADLIFHLAGVNRPVDKAEFTTGNLHLTQSIIKIIEKSDKKTPLVISSSIQAESNNDYGVSKKSAEDELINWSKTSGSQIYIYRLPNVFGKWSKPNYNSVVATFCNNIANNLPIKIDEPDKELSLVYIDDVITEFVKIINDELLTDKIFYEIPRTFKFTLQELVDKINNFKTIPETLLVPNFSSAFDRFLYATYTSYLNTDKFSYNLDTISDERGWLAEFIKSKEFGQIFVSCTKPGFTRGNHWHHTKIEKFLVISGEGIIRLRQLESNDIISYKVSGKSLEVVDMPAGYVHSITNSSDRDMITIFWTDELFNSNKPDTNYQEV
jgi:UDP-2-acetamido-2,6-beta-L-arabino-hexul-4-ose reductase